MRSHVTRCLKALSFAAASFNTASGMRSHVTGNRAPYQKGWSGFNTASGMRSHVTLEREQWEDCHRVFQYQTTLKFQYRKRYEITCDLLGTITPVAKISRFNTASGMRSHVTRAASTFRGRRERFQYRKRYEITCDFSDYVIPVAKYGAFQYRKRYEITCDHLEHVAFLHGFSCFNTASGMRSHVTHLRETCEDADFLFQYRKRYEITCDLELGN